MISLNQIDFNVLINYKVSNLSLAVSCALAVDTCVCFLLNVGAHLDPEFRFKKNIGF